MKNEALHTRKIFRLYFAEMSVTFLLYALVLTISIDVGRPMPASLARTLIAVSPMVPFLLMMAVIVRQFRRIDEYWKLQMLEDIVIAAGITATWTFAYGFLENVGFPKLSMFTVMPAMFAVWAVLGIFRSICR